MSKLPKEIIAQENPPTPGRFESTKNAIKFVMNSTPGKIVTSSLVGRTIGITSVLASAFVASVPATIIGLSSIAVGVVMDTTQTRDLRLLKKEDSLLFRHRKALEKQEGLLKNEPLLAEALKDKLYIPIRSDQNSVTDRYINTNPKQYVNVTSYGKALVKNSIDVIKNISGAIISPSVVKIGKLGKAAYGLYGESKKQATKEEIGILFKQNIDEERGKLDTPGYNNLTELAEITREQRVQALALKKMVADGSFHTANPKEIIEKFEVAKQEVLKTEKVIQDTRGMVGTSKSFAQDIVKTHNPFSKYNNLAQLKPKSKEVTQEIEGDKLSKLTTNKKLQNVKIPNKKVAIEGAKNIQAELEKSSKSPSPKKKHSRARSRKKKSHSRHS